MRPKRLLPLLVLPSLLISLAAGTDAAPIRTARQDALHEAADTLRAAGYTDTDPEIAVLSRAWWAEQEALDIVARTVYGEAGGCPMEHKIAVAAVVVNRVNDPRFPSTVREVISAPSQYTTAYLGGFDRTPRECYEAAKIALDGESGVPEDVVWQANFPQGTEAWWVSYIDTGWYRSTTYFADEDRTY